jgi:beta-lactamase superfamily II metal-dependent hydrolase
VSGVPLFRTDLHGDVTFETDGRSLRVRGGR